ncbi:preprotein translocase subunit SecG [bacterium]|nr:MAG: preprotein translocase subunit SecG [bacterium]
MIHTLLIIIHVLICIMLSVVVLLQSSKGGGLAGAFGGAGGAPQQLLGSRGMTTLLHKMTIYLAVAFFVSSFVLFMTDTSGTVTHSGVIDGAAKQGEFMPPVQEQPLDAPADAPLDAPATTQQPATQGGGGNDESEGGN